MGVKLMVEVLDHAAADWTQSERLLALVIAEQANDKTRVCYPGMALIVHRLGVADEKSVSRVLRRLSDRGYELRVPLSHKDGRPVFAARGRQSVYRLPQLCPQGEHTTAACLKRVAVQPPISKVDGMPADAEWVAAQPPITEDATQGRVAAPPPNNAERVADRFPKGGRTATPSPQIPSKNIPSRAHENAGHRGRRDWGQLDADTRRTTEAPEKLSEPLRTIYASLSDTDPGVTVDEARAVHTYIARQAVDAGTPIRSVKYYTAIARDGFSTQLAAVRALRLAQQADARTEAERAVKDQIARLRETEPDCPHGTAAGASPHPATGEPLCPQCRRGIAVPTQARSGRTDGRARITDAYRIAWQAAGHEPIEMTTLTAIAAEARRLLGDGRSIDTLITLAGPAARARHTLTYAEHHLEEATR
ncbi:helix-turn-helix domain-containing protein [Actinoplanes sp. URMC 104]|uniref:helix-turn-helix domain-containing protein n=1 Tax=Actinoplanes sp. URMC 104 TaxID=3423409 RepID=UPI003F1AF4A5